MLISDPYAVPLPLSVFSVCLSNPLTVKCSYTALCLHDRMLSNLSHLPSVGTMTAYSYLPLYCHNETNELQFIILSFNILFLEFGQKIRIF